MIHISHLKGIVQMQNMLYEPDSANIICAFTSEVNMNRRRCRYGYKEIAEASGVEEGVVRKARRAKRFNTIDLRSVSLWVVGRLAQKK